VTSEGLGRFQREPSASREGLASAQEVWPETASCIGECLSKSHLLSESEGLNRLSAYIPVSTRDILTILLIQPL
jgi:hypothetical protein